jgi:lipopolysaccharide transport system ATP-binding protein
MTVASVKFQNVSISFPVYNSTDRSLTSKFLEVATGGRLDSNDQGKVLVRALRDVSFSLQDGDRLGLVGHNGAGKSSLLRALAGVYVPTEGTVRSQGTVGSLIDISLGINPEATGRENVFIRGQLLGLSTKRIAEKFDEIVDFAQIGDFINLPVRTYSSGMQIRLAFAVSTIVSPEILLMDEWLSVGDQGFKAKAENRLRSVVSNSKILVLASHSKSLLESVCNKLLWLDHGSVKMFDKTSEVSEQYFIEKNPYTSD